MRLGTAPLGAISLLLATLTGCGGQKADAYGNFEATDVEVSAEVDGQLIRFDVEEGERLAAGVEVGVVDTTQAVLEIQELRAQRTAAQAGTGQAAAQVAALEAQLRTAEREHERTSRLFDDEAATARQLDEAASAVATLSAQLRGAQQQTSGSQAEADAVAARLDQLLDRLEKSHIVNPVQGTVLESFANAGEFVQPGQPLYRIANLDTLTLRAYVTGAQLARVRLNQPVTVQYDAAEGQVGTLPGRVSWIASEAEFTPTPIQTRDERADLVYAVEVRVPNPSGALKIGMPGELYLGPGVGNEDGKQQAAIR